MSLECCIILLHLLFFSHLNSAQVCSPFLCGTLGKFGFPFSNMSNPECGLSILDCTGTEPKVQFHENGKWYPVLYIDYSLSTIGIRDEDLQTYLQYDFCSFLNNFSQEVSPFLYINVTETRPFYKCKHEPISPSMFMNQFPNFTGCVDKGSYDLYFYLDPKRSLPPLPEILSNRCSVVNLPYQSIISNELKVYYLRSLFIANFTITWKVRPDCWDCHQKAGRCLNNPNKGFECRSSLKKGPSVRKKIATALTTASIVLVGGLVVVTIMMVVSYYSTGKHFLRTDSIVFIWKRKKKAQRKVEELLKNCGALALNRYNYSDIKKITSSFKDKIGEGGYGGVYKGKLIDGRLVAVKLLDKAKGDEGEEFINEVASISRTSHVNIVSLLGFCFDGSKRALIYEFMANGSLEKFIYGHNTLEAPSLLGWEKLYQIAIGVARGLEYLHRGCNTLILHFDIKPHNILLDQDYTPKISDFGLAKLCPKKESIISMQGTRGTIGYIAPEMVSRVFGGVSNKSDVYSYGMMVLEIVGKRKNVDARADRTSEIYFPEWVYNHLDNDLQLLGLNSIVEEDISKKMIVVALWCIQTNPADRPTMSKVVEMLEARQETLQIPPMPNLGSPPRSPIQSSNT